MMKPGKIASQSLLNDSLPKLRSAVSNLDKLLIGLDFVNVSDFRFDNIVTNLRRGVKLKADDLFVLIKRIVDVDRDLISTLKTQIKYQENQPVNMSILIQELYRTIEPLTAIDFSLECDLHQYDAQIKSIIGSKPESRFLQIVEGHFLNQTIISFALALKSLPGGFDGAEVLVSAIVSSRKSFAALEDQTALFYEVMRVLELSENQRFDQLDKLVAQWTKGAQAEWSTKLFNQKSGLGFIIKLALESKINFTRLEFPSINELLSVYRTITDTLKELETAVPERGEFWRAQIEQSSKVIAKKFDDRLIAVAIFYKNFVVVECGPKGYAGYVYDRQQFETHVLHSGSWRMKGLTTKAFSNLSGGRLLHTSGWQSNARILIREIVRS